MVVFFFSQSRESVFPVVLEARSGVLVHDGRGSLFYSLLLLMMIDYVVAAFIFA